MSTPTKWSKILGETGAVLARWLLGGLFVYMGFTKAMQPEAFLKLVHEYDVVQSPFLLNSIAATLPWFEVFCGLMLVFGVAVRGTALVLIAMLIPFTIVVFHRALEISSLKGISFCAVKFDCGCGTGEILICRKLAENTGLMFLAVWLLVSRRTKLSARYSLMDQSPILP
jgi:uncharacterized membrane protein YphA (DoxX/SURF4 family)